VLVATSVAAIVGSYLFLGCLLPVIALVVVAFWLVYGGAAAVLVVTLPAAAFAFALLWFSSVLAGESLTGRSGHVAGGGFYPPGGQARPVATPT
jgi:hypothetical protein